MRALVGNVFREGGLMDANELVKLSFQNWGEQEAGELRFGDRVQIMLAKREMSQKQLAKAIHCTDVSVSRYISNSRFPRAPIIVDMAKALGCTADYLLGLSPLYERECGHWIPHKSVFGVLGKKVYTCDRCGCNIGFSKTNYCPDCGAKMTEDKT